MRLRPCLSVLLAAASCAAADFPALLSRPILEPNLPTVEVQVYTANRVLPLPPTATAAAWAEEAARLRRKVLDEVVLRGEARAWADAKGRVEWLDVIETTEGYRIRKLRYEAIPGLWLPGLLYEPTVLSGKVPVVLNVNGHEKTGTATPYIQERCINLAKRGVLAFNPEWIGRGQMNVPALSHYRMNQLDLCGTSGISVFYLGLRRALDLALEHPHADPARIAVTGLSGGGWQTIFLGALDERVRLVNPVAGYSSYVTRAQFPALDLGDSEQTPSDLAAVVDYTHLTAMIAPRPALLTYNAKDNCCFRADYALTPLLQAARPIFRLTGAADRLRHHVNHDPGHNYGQDNREAFYRMLQEFFYAGRADFPVTEIPVSHLVRNADDLRVPLPADNPDFNTLARRLAAGLPRPGQPGRERLRALVRAPQYQLGARSVETTQEGDLQVTRWRLRLDHDWTVPAVEIAPARPTATVLLVADAGRAKSAAAIQELVASGHRVVALDPFYFGESRLGPQAGLFAILVAALGERPLGIQAGQIAATADWLQRTRGLGPVKLVSVGPRTGVAGLVAAALQPASFSGLDQREALGSLHDVIRRDTTVDHQPELFCFGLLAEFDLPQLRTLAGAR
jgi:dienelactone hydrolase